MSFDGFQWMGGYNNQQKVDFGGGRDIREGARLRWNVSGGRFAVVWDGELSGKNRHNKKRRGLRWLQNNVKNATIKQKRAASTDGRWDGTRERRGAQAERDWIVLGAIEFGGGKNRQ